MNSARRSWPGLCVGALLVAASGLCLLEFTFGSGLVRLSYDLLLVARRQIPCPEVLLIYLDEESHRILDQPLNAPWDRAIHARLLERLTAAGARIVLFDIVFTDPNPHNPEADQRFAQALRKHGRVILAADHVQVGPRTKRIFPPFDLLRDAAAAMGSAEVVPDRDMVVRQHTPEDILPNLSLATTQVLGIQTPQDNSASPKERWMNYYGPADFLPWMSYHTALDPQLAPDPVFKDKFVFVGTRILTRFAGERKDEYRSPFTFWSRESLFISGVEIQATAFLNLYRGDWLTRPPPGLERAVLALIGLVLGAGLVWLRPVPALVTALVVSAAVASLSFLLLAAGRIWTPWLIVVVQLGVGLAWAAFFNMVRLYVEKRLYEQTLTRYLSPKLVKKFSRDPTLLHAGAEKQVLTILFSDIVGFTSLSERMDSDALAELMNRYFECAVSECIHRTAGTVGKYIGDGILAFWNAPDRQEDHALRACQAALLFQNHQITTNDGQPLLTRIGIHTGVANVGNFGSRQRVDYTVLGDTVNLASRLEGLNKFLGTRSLISGDTKAEIKDNLVTRPLGRFRLKGLQKPVEVHELVGTPDSAQTSRPWREAFAQVLHAFAARQFDTAETACRRTLELQPEDGPARYYLAQIARLRTQNLPDPWQGEIDLLEK